MMSACKSLLGYCPCSRLTRHKTPFRTLPAYRLYVCVGPAFPLPVIINTFLCPKAWSVSSVKFVIYAFKCHAIFLCTALFMYALADICKTDMKFIKNLRQKSFEGKNFMQKTCNSPYLLTCNKGVSTSSFRWCDLWKLLVFTLDCIKDGFLKKIFWALPEYYHPHPLSCQPPPLQQFSSVLYQLRQIWSLLSAAPLCVSSVAADKKRLNQMSTLQYMSPVFRIAREVMWKQVRD